MLETYHFREIKRSQWVSEPIAGVFEFFSQAQNLNQITPPWLNFRTLTLDIQQLREGSRIDYSLKLNGFPFKWTSEITEWDPPQAFTDKQIKGPFHYWEHRHSFKQRDGGTEVADSVCFAVPGFFLESIIYHLFVRNQVERIFNFRENRIRQIFGGEETG
ncbi:SRPBCC family protein [Acidobacteriota bacterium]